MRVGGFAGEASTGADGTEAFFAGAAVTVFSADGTGSAVAQAAATAANTSPGAISQRT
jgi:hypothetical protein